MSLFTCAAVAFSLIGLLCLTAAITYAAITSEHDFDVWEEQ